MSGLTVGLLSAAFSLSCGIVAPVVSQFNAGSELAVVGSADVGESSVVSERDGESVTHGVSFTDGKASGLWLRSGVGISVRTRAVNVGDGDVSLSELPFLTYGDDEVPLDVASDLGDGVLSAGESCELTFTGVVPFGCDVFGIGSGSGLDAEGLSELVSLVREAHGDAVSRHEVLEGYWREGLARRSDGSPSGDEVSSDDNPAETHDASADADRLVYIQWAARPQDCWPVQGGSMSKRVDCGCETLIMAAILLTGDYSITPDGLFAGVEARYGSVSDSYKAILRYIEEEYGVHHRNVAHISASQAKEMLAAGHVISAGGGCENRDGLPFCKADGVRPRCCHGHVVLFYKYADGMFWAKDSAPGDGAAMCGYPDGPLTVTHQGALNGRCSHNGKTESYDNYADAFLRNAWNVELWV